MTIVVGYVSTKEGEAALERAFEECRLRKDKLVVIHSDRGGVGLSLVGGGGNCVETAGEHQGDGQEDDGRQRVTPLLGKCLHVNDPSVCE